MKIATILISIIDAAVAVIFSVIMFKDWSDPAFFGLGIFLGWAVPILCLVTALPAFTLAHRSKRLKSALALALAFPAGFVGLLVAVFLYFTYVL